ncbi:MAG: hypothetical protein QXF76_03245 [Candidatus Anstonellales archaeon]
MTYIIDFVKIYSNRDLVIYRPDEELLKNNHFPSSTYVMSSNASRHILFNPQIAGKELQEKMKEVSENYFSALKALNLLKDQKKKSVIELIFLAGGLYYYLNHGFQKTFNYALPQCFIGIQRSRIEGTIGKFTAKISYENYEALQDNSVIFIGDTIATGATITKGILSLQSALLEKNYSLKEIFIFSLACSTTGATKIAELEQRLKAIFNDCKITLIVCEQFFTLMEDGTDLRFLERDSILPKETYDNILKVYGEWLGKNMKCAVFDWGTRCKNPIKHYHEFIEFVDNITSTSHNIPTDAKNKLLEMKAQTLKNLNEIENDRVY